MKLEVLADAEAVAVRAAELIAQEAAAAVATRGRFLLAVSGGRTPWMMLRALADRNLPWPHVHVLQVDERVAPTGHADRNLTHLHASLLAYAPLREEQVHAMPVELADPETAAARYAATLRTLAGTPVVLDLVHLGLGVDGHTASLVPGDAALEEAEADVAATGLYQGRRRLTLTYPAIDRARRVLWVVTGGDKAAMLARLSAGDATIPAGRVRQERALVLADRAATTVPGPAAPA